MPVEELPNNPQKIVGFELKPLYTGTQIGKDDFDTYSGWSTLFTVGAEPTIVADGGYLKWTYTSAGERAIGNKINTSNGLNKVLKFKARIRSPATSVRWRVGIWQNIDNRIFVEAGDAIHKPSIAKIAGGVFSTPPDVSDAPDWVLDQDYELMLYCARSYVSLYYWDGSKWKRCHIWYTSLPINSAVTVFIDVYTGSACECWFNYVELDEAVGEGLKDPFFLSLKGKTIYTDGGGNAYLFIQGSAGSNKGGRFAYQYGQGVLLVYKTSDVKNYTQYSLFGKILNVHKVSGDAGIDGVTVYIFYSDYTGGAPCAGIGRCHIPLADFLAGNFGALVDEGIILTGAYPNLRDPDLYYDDEAGIWYMIAQQDTVNYTLYSLTSLSASPTLLGYVTGMTNFGEHDTLVGKRSDGRLEMTVEGRNTLWNYIQHYALNVSTRLASLIGSYYVEPNYTNMGGSYLIFRSAGNAFAPYIVYRGELQGETQPSEADFFCYALKDEAGVPPPTKNPLELGIQWGAKVWSVKQEKWLKGGTPI